MNQYVSNPNSAGYASGLWQGYAQPGGTLESAVGASHPPLPDAYSQPPPLPGEQVGLPPLPSDGWSSAPLPPSEAAPPLPNDPPDHGSGQGYPSAGHHWPPPDLRPGQYPTVPQQQLAASPSPYAPSYGSMSALPGGQGQLPWSQQGLHGVSMTNAPWATHTAQHAAYTQQPYASTAMPPQQFQHQTSYGGTQPYGATPPYGGAEPYGGTASYGGASPYGHMQPPQGAPPNPYAQMYGQRGAHGYSQMASPHLAASGHGISHPADPHAQAAPQYQQPGAWTGHTGQVQQPSWAHSPQPGPAANGYAPPQPPLPATPAAPREVAPSLPINAAPVEDLLSGPGRAKRPKLIAIVIRGLPGSGKSLIARRLRDAEVAAGGSAPRIHCIDDYFVTEVEKEVWEKDASGKRKMKLVQETEYCYEADMEGVYKASLLKAFRRTAEEGRSPFVIVDAPNLRVDDFKPYWDAGQRAGYEVYVLQAPETDVEVCFERNIHSRSLEDIISAQQQWELAPPSYPQLDVASLLRASSKPQAGIKEVDMEDDSADETAELDAESAAAARAKKGRWASLDDGADAQPQRPRKMQKSRFSETPKVAAARHKQGAWTSRKRVRWADEAEEEDTGFHIGGASLRQLETVYVLEGLGPPKEHSFGQMSFSDQVKADHKSEQHNFRDILLGKR